MFSKIKKALAAIMLAALMLGALPVQAAAVEPFAGSITITSTNQAAVDAMLQAITDGYTEIMAVQ